MYDRDWTAYVAKSLLQAGSNIAGSHLEATDGFFHSYLEDATIDWRAVHGIAGQHNGDIPPIGSPYWTDGKPVSILAFWGSSVRARIAADTAVNPSWLELMEADPSAQVRRNIGTNFSTPARVRARLAQEGAPARTSYANRHNLETAPPPGPSIKWGWVVAVVAILCVIGFNNGYSHEVREQTGSADRRPVGTGQHDVRQTSMQICGANEDFGACVNQHISVFNAVCVPNALTPQGERVCRGLSDFIDTVQNEQLRCGSGCRTRAGPDGRWGWSYLRAVERKKRPAKPPRTRHIERCSFDLGPIKVGSCPR